MQRWSLFSLSFQHFISFSGKDEVNFKSLLAPTAINISGKHFVPISFVCTGSISSTNGVSYHLEGHLSPIKEDKRKKEKMEKPPKLNLDLLGGKGVIVLSLTS